MKQNRFDMMLPPLKKIVATGMVVFLSFSICLAVSSEKESHFKIPVQPANIPNGMIYTGPAFQGIEIHVRGPEDILSELPSLKLRYVLDLSDMDVGTHTVPVVITQLNLPEGLSIVDFTPSSIHARLSKEIKKDVSVVVSCEGEPAPGFVIRRTEAQPASVLLSGPQYILEDIGSISTHPIDVTGLSEPFKKKITLDLIENVEVMSPTSSILAEIIIEEKMVTKTFSNINVLGKNAKYNFRISPPEISVEVKGPCNLMAGLPDEKGFNVYVDLKDLEPGVYVRCATIELPVDITLIHVTPEIFTVEVKK